MIRRILLVASVFGCLVGLAEAQDQVKGGGWSGEPDYVLEWLSSQHALSGMSCCGLGDAVNVEILGEDIEGIVLRVTNPRSRTEILVGSILHAEKESLVHVNLDPDDLAVAWVSNGGNFVYCLSSPPGI